MVAIYSPKVFEEAIASTRQPPRLFLAANLLSMNGGSRSVLEDLCEHLRTAGYPVVAASSYRSGLIRGLHLLKTALLMRHKYDLAVVDLYSGRAFLIAEALSILLHALNCPFVLVLRGGALPDFAKRQPRRVKACLRRANVTLAPSRYLLEEMQTLNDKLRLLPNPVNLAACTLKRRQKPQPKLVWLRAFHEIYNPTLAPKVVALLTKTFPNIQLTMVGRDKGDGSLARTREVAGALGVSNRMTIVGGVRKAEVTSWLNQGDIFLNTTNVDNTPVSVLEAMACGLCVVSTNVGGIPYLLEHERDALLVGPDHAAAMAGEVSRLLTEPGLGERLSRNGRLTAEQFDWPIVIRQWQALFASLAETRNGSAE